MVIKTAVPGQGAVTITAKGISALAPPLKGRFTMDVKGVAPGQDMALEMLMTPEAMFIKFPAEITKQLGGKTWVRMSFNDLAEQGGVDVKQIMEQSQQSSPTAYLKALVAGGNFKSVGKETIRGDKTTHYAGSVTPDQLASAYGTAKDSIAGVLKAMGDKPIKMDVWVAEDGLPRRLRQVSTIMGGKADALIEFLAFGEKLNVKPPAAADTMEFAELMAGKPAA